MDDHLAVQIGRVIEAQRRTEQDVDNLMRWARWAHGRLMAPPPVQPAPAQAPPVPQAWPYRAAAFAREVATPRHWAGVLVVVLAAVTGILHPEDIRDGIRHQLGLPPLSGPAPS